MGIYLSLYLRGSVRGPSRICRPAGLCAFGACSAPSLTQFRMPPPICRNCSIFAAADKSTRPRENSPAGQRPYESFSELFIGGGQLHILRPRASHHYIPYTISHPIYVSYSGFGLDNHWDFLKYGRIV